MNRRIMAWTCRGGFLLLVGGAFVGAYGCGTVGDDCVELGNCKPFVSASGGPVKAGNEVCKNGVDDDGDGKADCLDSDCANLIVCNERDDGWEYRTIQKVAHDASAAGLKCADNTVAERLYEGHLPHPGCNDCTCTKNNAQVPLSCVGSPELECTQDYQGDQTTWTQITSLPDFTCQKPSELQYMYSCQVKPALIDASPCTAGGGGLRDGAAWTNDVFSCPIAANTRVDQEGACLRRTGNVSTCPSGWDAQRILVYKSESGTRACTQCSCTGECASTITIYNDMGCPKNGPPGSKIVVSTSRMDVSAMTGGEYSIQKNVPVPPSECTPSTSEPVEVVKPANPVTFCCK